MANTSPLRVEENVVDAGSAMPKHNFPALDGLRAIAITAVLVTHFRGGIDLDSPANRLFVFWTNFGWMGVDLFFVLSGFLITGILLDSKQNAPILPWLRFFRPFYGRRILRIFPLYWVYLLIVWKLIRPLAKAAVAHTPLFSEAMRQAQEIPKEVGPSGPS
jgi:peptidoglycan/LPS O-acetylase OafA/YrhL